MNDEEIVEDVLQEREESESENEASSNAVTLFQACAAFDTEVVGVQRQHTLCTSYAGKKLERRCSSASLEIYKAN